MVLQRRLADLQEEHGRVGAVVTQLRNGTRDAPVADTVDAVADAYHLDGEDTIARDLWKHIEQVRHALQRLDEGSYGHCEQCGETIPVDRLLAFPAATLCVACKTLQERR